MGYFILLSVYFSRSDPQNQQQLDFAAFCIHQILRHQTFLRQDPILLTLTPLCRQSTGSPGCLRPKMEAITISPITHDGILLFACTFCYGHIKFSLYQQQQTLESLFTERMKIFPFRPFALSPIQYLNKKELIRNAIHLS